MLSKEQRLTFAKKAMESRSHTRAERAVSESVRSALRERIRNMRDEQKMSWRAIAAALNEERVPTLRGGTEWRQSSVQTVGGYEKPPTGRAVTKKRVSVPQQCESCGKTYLSWSNKRLCSNCYGFSRGFTCGGCGAPVLRDDVRHCRMCQNLDQTGTGNGRWKGGRRTAAGYIYIYAPDHPHVSKAKYVSEHQLVMESVLGRYLLPGENVHHRNGVKDDNRPENLELWVVSQPAGQRAVELLAWAREIIERYEPIEGQLRLFD